MRHSETVIRRYTPYNHLISCWVCVNPVEHRLQYCQHCHSNSSSCSSALGAPSQTVYPLQQKPDYSTECVPLCGKYSTQACRWESWWHHGGGIGRWGGHVRIICLWLFTPQSLFSTSCLSPPFPTMCPKVSKWTPKWKMKQSLLL